MTGFLANGNNLQQFDLSGNCVREFSTVGRIQDIALSPNGRYLVAIDHKSRLSVFDLLNRERDYKVEMTDKLSSVAVSQDSKTVLVGTSDGEARIVNIRSRQLQNSFTGQVSREFVIKTSFGGAHDAFVTSGSEGTNVLEPSLSGLNTDNNR